MSTQADPEDAPWLNYELLKLHGFLDPPKRNSPIQVYYESVIPSAWLSGAAVGSAGTSATLTSGALPAHLGIKKNTVITPGTGSMTIDSEKDPENLEVNVSDDVSVEDPSESPSRPQASDGLVVSTSASDSEAPMGGADWLEDFSRFIPKEFKDDWLGDLREERKKWMTEGRSRPYIEWRTGVQIFFLALFKLGAIIGWIFRIYTQLSGWFGHNR